MGLFLIIDYGGCPYYRFYRFGHYIVDFYCDENFIFT